MTHTPEIRTFAATAVHADRLAAAGARFPGYRIAAIVPCHNEEAAIGKVVADLVAAVPDMDVYVYDNCSTDRTVEVARRAGAIVRSEQLKGKGNVVRRAFADIDADVYLLIDGDDTYDAAAAPDMISALLAGPYDHVLGIREPEATATEEVYRGGHERGNRILNKVVARIFGTNAGDMLSGYRVFSRRFVKSFPAMSREFEIETELTVHCLALRVPATSMPVGFRDRAQGSESKLRTYHDGFRILRLIMNLTRHERPIAFYGLLAASGNACRRCRRARHRGVHRRDRSRAERPDGDDRPRARRRAPRSARGQPTGLPAPRRRADALRGPPCGNPRRGLGRGHRVAARTGGNRLIRMRTTRLRWTGAAPVTAALLVLGLFAALVSPAIRHALSVSFQRQPARYVELYFADESAARSCPVQDGTLRVVATVRSHLADPVAVPFAVTVSTGVQAEGIVGTTPGSASDFGATVAVPRSAYTVQVTLPGRSERLLLHCPGTTGS